MAVGNKIKQWIDATLNNLINKSNAFQQTGRFFDPPKVNVRDIQDSSFLAGPKLGAKMVGQVGGNILNAGGKIALKAGEYAANKQHNKKPFSWREEAKRVVPIAKEGFLTGLKIQGAASPKTLIPLTALDVGIKSTITPDLKIKPSLSRGLDTAQDDFGSTMATAGLISGTNPYMNKLLVDNKVTGFVGRNIGTGISNVLEDKALAELQGMDYGTRDALTSFLAPAVIESASKVITVPFKTADMAIRKAYANIIKFTGGKLRNNKGAYTTYNKWLNGTRAYFKRDPSLWAGLVGIEPYQDENGDWKVRVNQKRAVLGMALMLGGTKKVDMDQVAKMLQLPAGRLQTPEGNPIGKIKKQPEVINTPYASKVQVNRKYADNTKQPFVPKDAEQAYLLSHPQQRLAIHNLLEGRIKPGYKNWLDKVNNQEVNLSPEKGILLEQAQKAQPTKTQSPSQGGNILNRQKQVSLQDNQTPSLSTKEGLQKAQSSQFRKQTGSYDGNIPQNKYAFNINKERINANPDLIEKQIKEIQPELERIKGKPLTHDEIKIEARKAEVMSGIKTREETLDNAAKEVSTRNRIAELEKIIFEKKGTPEELKKATTEVLDLLKVLSADNADAGRRLAAKKIRAGEESLRADILKKIAETTHNTEKLINDASEVDWNNAVDITKFYREYVQPTKSELFDELRYNNMLSNPLTQLRNIYSNAFQTSITRPATLAAQGRPIEALKYYSGVLQSFPTAIKKAIDTFKGKDFVEKPDIDQLPTNKLPKLMTVPTRALEAADKFFTELISGGELARGADADQAAATAAYSLFRQNVNTPGQGKLLQQIDNFTDGVYAMGEKFPAFRWFVPFVRTPTNFAKQWLEYSPAGIATLPGAANKREQLAKAMLGSTVTLIGADLALNDRLSWATPTDPKEKQAFFDEGRKPFSVLIGDKWVPMMYFGPFAFALALPAAFKHYFSDDRNVLTTSNSEKISSALMDSMKLLSEQTFLEGIDNFVKLLSGDVDYSFWGNMAFTAGQVVPGQGFNRYLTTVLDPVYRKVGGDTQLEKIVNTIKRDIPLMSKSLEAYTDSLGNPSKRLPINLIAPYSVGQQNKSFEGQLKARQSKLQINAVKNDVKKKLESGKESNKILTSKTGVKYALVDNTIIFNDADGTTTTMDLRPIEPPVLTGEAVLDKELIKSYKSKLSSRKTTIRKLYEIGVLSKEQAVKLISSINAETGSGKKLSASGPSLRKMSVPSAKRSASPKLKTLQPSAKLKLGGKANKPKPAKLDLDSLRNPKL